MPLAVGLTVAVVVILWGCVMLRRNLSTLPHRRWIVWVLVVIGVVAGIPLGSLASHQDAYTRVYGLPLTVVILELRNEQWLDFVGLMTPVGFVLNTLTWAAVWQVVLAAALYLLGKGPHALAEPR